jgi:hypothetical protein
MSFDRSREIQSRLIKFLLLMAIGTASDAANTPPPARAQCRITCIVDEKAEWKTDRQSEEDFFIIPPQVQTSHLTPVLIINSNHESAMEMDNNGNFRSGNFPVDIIRRTESQEDRMVTTITACWKI